MLPIGINQAGSDASIEVGPVAGHADLGVNLLPTLNIPRECISVQKEKNGYKNTIYQFNCHYLNISKKFVFNNSSYYSTISVDLTNHK